MLKRESMFLSIMGSCHYFLQKNDYSLFTKNFGSSILKTKSFFLVLYLVGFEPQFPAGKRVKEEMVKKLNLKLEDRDTLHSKVCNALRKAILCGDLKPGERLVQAELAEALGVSRMPVREALRKLESEGLVTIEPHRGAIVKSFGIEDIKEIYELRAELEKMAIKKSIQNMKEEDIAALDRLVLEMEQAADVEAFVEKNIEFHRLLLSRCLWNRLLDFIETLWNGFPQQTPLLIKGQVHRSNEEHRKILLAVKGRDAEKAAWLLSEHILRTGESLIASLQEKTQNNAQERFVIES
jgi:DNA-binding GntR family transcriptional regulator